MIDYDTNRMVGIDNGLVGIEMGRGEYKNELPLLFAGRIGGNCEDYVGRLIGRNKTMRQVVYDGDVLKVEAFIKSDKFEALIDAHFGDGEGAEDLRKRGISLDEFKKNYREGAEYGVSLLKPISTVFSGDKRCYNLLQ